MAEADKKKKFSDTFSAAGGTDEEKKKRFAAGGMIAMAAFMAGGIFQILWMNTVTMKLGSQKMGMFGPLMFGFYCAATILAMGIPQTITTFVSLHYEKQIDESKKFITDGMRLLWTTALCVVIFGCGIAALLGATGVISWFNAALIIAFITAIGQMAIFWGLNGILNGFQRLDLVSVGNMIFPIMQFAASLALIMVAQKAMLARHMTGPEARWDVIGAVIGLGLGQGAAAIGAALVLIKLNAVSLKDLFKLRSAHGLYGKIIKFGGLAAAALVIMTIVQNLPGIVVRLVGMKWLLFGATSAACESQIGLFSTSLIFGQATMLVVGIAMAVIPAISEAEGQGRHDMMQHYYNSAFQQAFVILVAFIIVFAAVIGPIIELMSGPEYPAATMSVLGTLAVIGGAGCGALYLLINIFIGLKKPSTPAIVLILVVVLLLISTVGLSFGFKNVSWASAGFIIATWIGSVILFIAAKNKFKLKFPVMALLEPVAAGAIPLAIVLFFMPKINNVWVLADKAKCAAVKCNSFVVAGVPGSYYMNSKQFWVIGADLLIVLVPFGLIMMLLGKRRKKLEPAIDDLKK
ncbi:MAG: MATE family efflux transporter [bacterium]